MVEQQRCTSCKKSVANDPGSVTFLCPSCGKVQIVRCRHCRTTAVRYTCPKCGLTGP